MMQIGSNELRHLCLWSQVGTGPGSLDDFETDIRVVLEYVKRKFTSSSQQPPFHPLCLLLVCQYHSEPDRSIQALWYREILQAKYHPTKLRFVQCALLGGDITRKEMDDPG